MNNMSLIGTFVANHRMKRNIELVEQNNLLRKGIVKYQYEKPEVAIEKDFSIGSYIISGGNQEYRSRMAAAIAVRTLMQNIPVVLLHEGDVNLENRVTNIIPGHSRMMLPKNIPKYDPFYNRSDKEIGNLIWNSLPEGTSMDPMGLQYIAGVTAFIRSKGIPSYCDMLLSCPHNNLIDKIDDSVNRGFLTGEKALHIKNLLMQGQTERAKVQSFFVQLEGQENGILADRNARKSVVNIKEMVRKRQLIAIDIGSSTNEILLSLIVNEIKEILASGTRLMLMIDGIHTNSNSNLKKLMSSLPAYCLATLISSDVYAMLGSDDTIFTPLVGRANKSIILNNTVAVTNKKWAEVIGWYDEEKVAQNFGNDVGWWGCEPMKSIHIMKSREHRVKPEEISKLKANEFYVLNKSSAKNELAHVTIQEQK